MNDATDIAASLKDAGFDVILRTDQDLAGMEGALADFQTLMRGKDTALFYYAGHGLQVDGENFLIPVKEKHPELRPGQVPVGIAGRPPRSSEELRREGPPSSSSTHVATTPSLAQAVVEPEASPSSQPPPMSRPA